MVNRSEMLNDATFDRYDNDIDKYTIEMITPRCWFEKHQVFQKELGNIDSPHFRGFEKLIFSLPLLTCLI